MTHVARYIIVLDRYDDDDYSAEAAGYAKEDGYGHDGSAKAACEQVAGELQEAMEQAGVPAGFFNVIERRVFNSPPGHTVTNEEATPENLCRTLGINRLMQDDPRDED